MGNFLTGMDKRRWAGWFVTVLAAMPFVMSAVMKFSGSAEVSEGMKHLGLPETLLTPLGILEASCLLIYLIPHTAVLGAVLLTGYLGGAKSPTCGWESPLWCKLF